MTKNQDWFAAVAWSRYMVKPRVLSSSHAHSTASSLDAVGGVPATELTAIILAMVVYTSSAVTAPTKSAALYDLQAAEGGGWTCVLGHGMQACAGGTGRAEGACGWRREGARGEHSERARGHLSSST